MADELSEGQQEELKFRQYGASDDQVNEWRQGQVAEFRKAGANDKQINDYFGVKETDTSDMKAYAQKNLSAFAESRKAKDGTPQKEAASFGEAFHAGWENSATGLATTGHLPDTVLPEHAGFFSRLASNVGQLAGDAPAMLAGGFFGGMVGGGEGAAAGTVAAPGVGTVAGGVGGSVLGAGAGAFAAPAAIRKMLMDHYEKGDVQDAGDFMARLASTTWEAIKGGTVGALTAGTGAIVKPLAGAAVGLGAELTTMTTAGAAMEGRLPQPQEFIDGAVLLGGFHLASGTLPGKLRSIYANTGERPADVIEAANNDVTIKQKLLAENPGMPEQAANTGPEEPTEKVPAKSDQPPPEAGSIEEARQKILSHVAEEKEAEKTPWFSYNGFTKEGLAKSWSDFQDNWNEKVYDKIVNKYSPLWDAAKSYQAATQYTSWKGVLERTIKSNTIDAKTGAVTGEGLEKIFNDIPAKDKESFRAYWFSERALEREQSGENQEGKTTGFDLDAAQKIVDTDRERFKPTLDRLNDFDHRMLKYAMDSDILSKESYKNLIEKSGNYLPLQKSQSLDPYLGEMVKGFGGDTFEFMKGSDKQVKNPIEGYYKHIARILEESQRNKVGLEFAKYVEEQANTPAKPGEETGIPLAEKIERSNGGANEFTFKRDGQEEIWRTDQRTADALNAMNHDPGLTNVFVKVMMVPASLLRAGTVLAPDFITRHFVRQAATGSIYSQSVKMPFVDSMKYLADCVYSIGHVVKEDNVYQNFLSSGATAGTIKSITKYFDDKSFWRPDEPAGGYTKQAWNMLGSAKEGLEWLAHIADTAQRVAEFKRLGGVDTGEFGKPGYEPASPEAKALAGTGARNVTLDYDVNGGVQTKALRAIIPFANIAVQGMDRLVQAARNDPKGFAVKALAGITAPTLALWAYNRNDSRYQDAPEWEKDLYWLIPTNKWEKAANLADVSARPKDLVRQAADGSWEVNNGTTIRISKPFELGILFGSLPERIVNQLHKDSPDTAKQIAESILQGFHGFGATALHGALPNAIPTAIQPMFEQAANHVMFTGRPIVSDHLQGELPEYQYNEYTSTTARQIAKLIGYTPLKYIGPQSARLNSPQVVDNYIREWSGTMGQYALQLAGGAEHLAGVYGNASRPTWTMADVPFVKAFISRNPSQNMQPIQDFYENDEKAARNNKTIQTLLKSQDPEDVKNGIALQQKTGFADTIRLQDIKKALGAQAAFIKTIDADQKYSSSDKRQLIDRAYFQMIQTAKAGNQALDQLKKQIDAQQ